MKFLLHFLRFLLHISDVFTSGIAYRSCKVCDDVFEYDSSKGGRPPLTCGSKECKKTAKADYQRASRQDPLPPPPAPPVAPAPPSDDEGDVSA